MSIHSVQTMNTIYSGSSTTDHNRTHPPYCVRIVQYAAGDEIAPAYIGMRGTLPGTGSTRYGGNSSCATLEFLGGPFFIFDAGEGIKSLPDRLLADGWERIEYKERSICYVTDSELFLPTDSHYNARYVE